VERVLGFGGVFFKASNPKALAEWYATHLGVTFEANQTYGIFTAAAGDQTVFSLFAADTTYFAPSTSAFMLNFRVSNLQAMLAQLRAGGAQVEERVEEYDYGNFGWLMDPEGNRIELWEPKQSFA
jgi:predicted enzyme related to lactoylglutathione lyase